MQAASIGLGRSVVHGLGAAKQRVKEPASPRPTEPTRRAAMWLLKRAPVALRAPDLVGIQPVARKSFSVVASQQLC